MGHINKLEFADPAEETREERAEANRQTASIAGLAIALLLVVVGLWIFKELHAESVLEDCLMSGQRGCSMVIGAVL